MMPPLRDFDDMDGRKRGQKKTDDLRAMTTLGPRTLFDNWANVVVSMDINGIHYRYDKTLVCTRKE